MNFREILLIINESNNFVDTFKPIIQITVANFLFHGPHKQEFFQPLNAFELIFKIESQIL